MKGYNIKIFLIKKKTNVLYNQKKIFPHKFLNVSIQTDSLIDNGLVVVIVDVLIYVNREHHVMAYH